MRSLVDMENECASIACAAVEATASRQDGLSRAMASWWACIAGEAMPRTPAARACAVPRWLRRANRMHCGNAWRAESHSAKTRALFVCNFVTLDEIVGREWEYLSAAARLAPAVPQRRGAFAASIPPF
ncbi:hypothetical protein NRY95_07605 [Xanthomonas campestris pv. phormiicola]|nr:hypothetical protein [Xanthomonas campestris pv. phormiicola]UYC17807.1 hypothetical protein NRY95_07605 [Xanthomonas campestris pv. phormiicola]